MTLDELNNLDPQNIGNWPLPIRIGLIAVVCIVVGYIGYNYDISGQLATLDERVQEEQTLKETFESKQRRAANLQALKDQLEEMKRSFGDLLRQLPDDTEVAGLIVDISQAGLAAGLEFELFKPDKEKPGDFYSELPISIRVVGNYHQLGEFISSIAVLPRIVTTHDVRISKGKGGGGQQKGTQSLVMEATAKTYRALSEEEEDA